MTQKSVLLILAVAALIVPAHVVAEASEWLHRLMVTAVDVLVRVGTIVTIAVHARRYLGVACEDLQEPVVGLVAAAQRIFRRTVRRKATRATVATTVVHP